MSNDDIGISPCNDDIFTHLEEGGKSSAMRAPDVGRQTDSPAAISILIIIHNTYFHIKKKCQHCNPRNDKKLAQSIAIFFMRVEKVNKNRYSYLHVNSSSKERDIKIERL